nr:hypothetical protein [Micromonospora sp. DSM 115978]
VVVGLLLFGLVLDRAADRLMLLTARVAVAVTYLRAEILPTLPWRPDVANAYLLATGMIILLAVAAARWRRVPPAVPPGWPPGGYGHAGQGRYPGQGHPGQSHPTQGYSGNAPGHHAPGHPVPGSYPGRQPQPGPGGGYYG